MGDVEDFFDHTWVFLLHFAILVFTFWPIGATLNQLHSFITCTFEVPVQVQKTQSYKLSCSKLGNSSLLNLGTVIDQIKKNVLNQIMDNFLDLRAKFVSFS